jgi:hypothetical protein
MPPLRRKAALFKNRQHGANVHARATIYTNVGVDEHLLGVVETIVVRPRVNAVHRANIDAGIVRYARRRYHIRQFTFLTRLKGQREFVFCCKMNVSQAQWRWRPVALQARAARTAAAAIVHSTVALREVAANPGLPPVPVRLTSTRRRASPLPIQIPGGPRRTPRRPGSMRSGAKRRLAGSCGANSLRNEEPT